jgi:hypothetical protein
MIWREEKSIDTTVTRTFYDFYEMQILDVEVEEVQTIGGWDICPVCVKRSETEWEVQCNTK